MIFTFIKKFIEQKVIKINCDNLPNNIEKLHQVQEGIILERLAKDFCVFCHKKELIQNFIKPRL